MEVDLSVEARVVRVEVGPGIAYWTPLVGPTLEHEPTVRHFLRHLVIGRGRAENTSKSYAEQLAPFVKWRLIHGLSWEDAARDMDGFLIWRRAQRRTSAGGGVWGPSAATLRHAMTAVNEFYRHAVSFGLVNSSVMPVLFEVADTSSLPLEVMPEWSSPQLRLRSRFQVRAGTLEADRERQSRRSRTRAVSRDDALAVLGQVRTARDALILAFMLRCGLRVGQVVTVRRDRVHVSPTVRCQSAHLGPHLHVERVVDHPKREWSKSRTPFVIPVPADVIELYSGWLRERVRLRGAKASPWLFLTFAGPAGSEGRPIGRSAVTAMLSACCERAGVRRLTPHQFRHGFGQAAADAGMPADVLQQLMGHASVKSQEIYRTVSDQQTVTWVQRLDSLPERLVR